MHITFTILSVQFSGIMHIHSVVQPSPLPTPRPFVLSQTQSLDPPNTTSPFPLPQPLATTTPCLCGPAYARDLKEVLSFSVWLTSLSVTSRRLIQVVTYRDSLTFYGRIVLPCVDAPLSCRFLFPVWLEFTSVGSGSKVHAEVRLHRGPSVCELRRSPNLPTHRGK